MIFVVITDYNGWPRTRVCLEHLGASSFREFGTIVVDHGTTDDTERALRGAPPGTIRVKASPELWWTGATNVGIREALARGAAAVVLLNNDCYVAPDTLSILVSHAKDLAEPAIIAPLQRDLRSRRLLSNFVTSCFLLGFPTLERPWPRNARPGEHKLLRTNLIMGGRGVLIPRQVLDRVGLPDEQALPHYGSDHDFYLRCHRRGVLLYLALDAFVDIDDRSTTLAQAPDRVSLRAFAATFSDRRSHRNMHDLAALFRRHYPIPGLYGVGVTLNLLRYSVRYLMRRLARACDRAA